MLRPVKLTGQTTVAVCVGQALSDEIRGMPCRHSIQDFVRRSQTYGRLKQRFLDRDHPCRHGRVLRFR
jgi:hypothetical protein